MIANRVDLYQSALGAMNDAPKALDETLQALATVFHVSGVSSKQFVADCEAAGHDDPPRLWFHSALAKWDYQSSPRWGTEAPPSTKQRRIKIYDLLKLRPAERSTCDELFPYAPAVDQPTTIVDPEGWRPWYTPERQAARHYYWDSYERQLTNVRKWDAQNLAAMRESTVDVIQRMSDPEAMIVAPTKGLVVGYVQSGKTANFTGVLARAADAGYRLFIVLAGTQNTLRDQTQRRLDKELIGRELLGTEYTDSDDYLEFVTHNGRPSLQGSFDWERLTFATEDFRHLRAGLAALRFKRYDQTKPFRHPQNLHRESARLIVVKKNPSSLKNLIKSLKEAASHVKWADVPSVVVDDESDQASVNTGNVNKDKSKRTTINRLIVELLNLLQTAQYVGYTATPFANVLIDADDAEDLFPANYIVSLPRPAGYMGVGDFYDDEPAENGDFTASENVFVRSVSGSDDKSVNLPQAIDAFILAGAIKLFRQQHGQKPFRHHTMLVHQSPNKQPQLEQAQLVRHLIASANYTGGGPGTERLQALWKSDFQPVCAAQAGKYAIPGSFAELRPHIGECYANLQGGGDPVLVLNGDYQEDTPDFDRRAVWKIIVGGAKLSRGYTVEGLTVSYYRRRAQAADTLMQMGRWFGYREGYRDLVRLYIGREEPIGKSGTIDLYEAFRATCRDEEEFRGEIRRYSALDGAERLTPKQVPPLVPSHMLRPTATNKMYNSCVTFRNFGSAEVQKTIAPADKKSRVRNQDAMRALLGKDSPALVEVAGNFNERLVKFRALTLRVSREALITFIDSYVWKSDEKPLRLVSEFLKGARGDSEVDSWLILAPQAAKTPMGKWRHAGTDYGIRERSRNEDDTRYLIYSESSHMDAAKYFAHVAVGSAVSAPTARLRRTRQGVMLFYPVLSSQECAAKAVPTMGFALQVPPNSMKRQIAYSVIQREHRSKLVVTA